MTTYTVTINGEIYREVTAATLKTMRKNNGTKNVKATKNEAPKFWYYRGTQIIIHEERQNNRTIISSFDGTYNSNSVMTHELEYR